MYTFLLQDWLTVRAGPAFTFINQSAESYLDMTGFQDVVAWTEVKSLNGGGGSALILTFQSSPTKDDVFFLQFGPPGINTLALSVVPFVTSSSSVTNPLARWLRWQLLQSGTAATSTWDATFRIFICANAGAGGQKALPGVPIPPSARAGVPMHAGAPGAIVAPVMLSSSSTPLHVANPTAPSFRAQMTGGRRIPIAGGPSVPLHQQPPRTVSPASMHPTTLMRR
jgi:hypothetical protein